MSANQGIAERTDRDLVAERDRRIGAHLETKPPWWRIFARRRWRQKLDTLRAMDVSLFAAMLRSVYTRESVEDLAKQSGPAARLMAVAKARSARGREQAEQAYDQLAAWTDAQNGVAVYVPMRMKERRRDGRSIAPTR